MLSKMGLNNLIIRILIVAIITILAGPLYASPILTPYGNVDYADTKIENEKGFEQQVCVHGIPATLDKPIIISATLYNNIIYKGAIPRYTISGSHPCYTINLGKTLQIKKDTNKAKVVWWEELSDKPIGETTFPLKQEINTSASPLPTVIIQLNPKSDAPHITEKKPTYLKPNDYTQMICLGDMVDPDHYKIPKIRISLVDYGVLYNDYLISSDTAFYRTGKEGIRRCFDIDFDIIFIGDTGNRQYELQWFDADKDILIGTTQFINPLPPVILNFDVSALNNSMLLSDKPFIIKKMD